MAATKGIYAAIEEVLKDTDSPLTAVDLWDMPAIRQYVKHVNNVSDTLGQMWRRGYLNRVPAPKDPSSQAKWAYMWGRTGKKPRTETRAPIEPTPAPAPARTDDPKIVSVTTTRSGNEIVVRIVLESKK